MTITDRDIRDQIGTAVNAGGSELAEGIDVEAVTREIVATHGLVDIDDIPSDEFWAIVARHDATQGKTYTILVEIEDHDTIIRYPVRTGVTEDEASAVQANIKAQARKSYPGSTVTVKAIEEKAGIPLRLYVFDPKGWQEFK